MLNLCFLEQFGVQSTFDLIQGGLLGTCFKFSQNNKLITVLKWKLLPNFSVNYSVFFTYIASHY